MFNKLYLGKQTSSLEEFKKWLKKSGASDLTIKNYLSDIKTFLSDAKENSIYSPASIKRRNSAVKKYLEYSSAKKLNSYPLFVFLFGALLVLLVVSQLAHKSSPDGETFVYNNDKVALPSNTTIYSNNRLPSLKGEETQLVVLKPTAEIAYVAAMNDPIAVSAGTAKNAEEANSGHATIPAGKKDALVLNSLVSENSFIYLTSRSSTRGQALYVKTQGEGYFIVAMDTTLASDASFQWKVDNTEVYHSIF